MNAPKLSPPTLPRTARVRAIDPSGNAREFDVEPGALTLTLSTLRTSGWRAWVQPRTGAPVAIEDDPTLITRMPDAPTSRVLCRLGTRCARRTAWNALCEASISTDPTSQARIALGALRLISGATCACRRVRS